MGNSQSSSFKAARVDQDGDGGPDGIEKHSKGVALRTSCGEPAEGYWDSFEHSGDIIKMVVGLSLEWFEFGMFSLLVPELEANFFHGNSQQAWLSFAIAYASRPFGGYFIGWIGDTFGRKPQSIVTICGISAMTLLQGLLPSNYFISGWAGASPTIFMASRVLQGLCIGGEVSGSSSYIAEKAPKAALGTFFSMAAIGGALATLASSATIVLLHEIATQDQMTRWVWRVPFIGCGLIGVGGLLLRLTVPETDEFIKAEEQRESKGGTGTIEVDSSTYAKKVLYGLGVQAARVPRTYILAVYSFSKMQTFMDPAKATGLKAIMAGGTLLALPFIGFVADTWGEGKLCMVCASLTAVTALPFSLLLLDPVTSYSTRIGIVVVLGVLEGLTLHNLLISNSFGVETRARGVGFTENVASAVMGGFAPSFLEAFPNASYLPGIYVGGMALSGLCVLVWARSEAADGKMEITHIRSAPY